MRPIRILLAAAVLLVVLPSSSAFAVKNTEEATSGQVTATFSYDFKRSKYGAYDFSNSHVTIVRAGQTLVDETLGKECSACTPWPADMGSNATKSVTVRDLDADGEPEVLVDLYSGGANCCWYTDSYRYDETTGKYIKKVLRPGLSFPYTLQDIDHNGIPEFKSVDYRFAYKYGSNADTPRPLRIFNWNAGDLVDVTIAFPKLAARDAAGYYKTYLQLRNKKDVNVRGVMAAYVADMYNARQGKLGWKRLEAAFMRGDFKRKIKGDVGPFGRNYVLSLRKFLGKLGYLRSA
jgi:hypothetical protein